MAKKFFIVLLFSLIVVYGKSYAASQINGITISPAIQQIQLQQNQNSDTFYTNITNNTSTPIVVHVGAEDFTYLNQSGAISFIKTKPGTSNSHGLVSGLVIALNQFYLSPHQSQTVPIRIVNANNLAIGGHYAAIYFQVNGKLSAGKNVVAINQAVTSLVFLSTFGQGTQNIKLESLELGTFMSSFPSSLALVLQNTGNTQSTPTGIVQIVDSHGAVLTQTQLNTDSGLILPSSSRLFNFSLNKPTKHIFPGIYTLKFYYRYSGQSHFTLYQKKFIYIGWPITLGLIIIAIAFVVYFFFAHVPPNYYKLNKK